MFARNSLIRDMTFRANFLIELVSSFVVVADEPGVLHAGVQPHGARRAGSDIAGWTQYEFFVFIATTILVNSLVEAFFMENAEELSELTRTGGLDFALLKPIDTQFLGVAAEGQLVGARQAGAGGWACWRIRCRGSRGCS